jgi:hypothetical protein
MSYLPVNQTAPPKPAVTTASGSEHLSPAAEPNRTAPTSVPSSQREPERTAQTWPQQVVLPAASLLLTLYALFEYLEVGDSWVGIAMVVLLVLSIAYMAYGVGLIVRAIISRRKIIWGVTVVAFAAFGPGLIWLTMFLNLVSRK